MYYFRLRRSIIGDVEDGMTQDEESEPTLAGEIVVALKSKDGINEESTDWEEMPHQKLTHNEGERWLGTLQYLQQEHLAFQYGHKYQYFMDILQWLFTLGFAASLMFGVKKSCFFKTLSSFCFRATWRGLSEKDLSVGVS